MEATIERSLDYSLIEASPKRDPVRIGNPYIKELIERKEPYRNQTMYGDTSPNWRQRTHSRPFE